MRRHYDGTCEPPRAGVEVNPRECPHCKKLFSQASVMKTHVGNGCPALNPDSVVGKVAADARRMREEAETLKRKSDEYYRYVVESREKEKDATGWLEIYKEKAALAEAKAERLELENAELRAKTATAAAGGAGGRAVSASAGRDTRVDQSTKVINLNIYGQENMDPAQFSGLVNALLEGTKRMGTISDEARAGLRQTVFAGGVRLLLGGKDENEVVRGWKEESDEVETHEGDGEWGSRPAEEVAGYYGRRVGRTMEELAPEGELPAMGGEELGNWKKRQGSAAVRKVAVENEIREALRKMKRLGRDEVDVLLGR